uniref:Uncharacterized protein ORF 18 n=1 Tax=Bovine herpesvirus 4 TaxID=10385 RepID=G1EUQ3_BHV4|nr:hypothetical protein [Bovine gammaherpesvirus 4]
MLGKYVVQGKEMSPGLRRLMWKAIHGRGLNTYTSEELKFTHMVLCHMYNYCLNIYLLKEALANAGTRDDDVLGRKVPVEFWKILYDQCGKMNIQDDILACDKKSEALWLHMNSNVQLLDGLSQCVFRSIGLRHHVKIHPEAITDGNYLYNLGSIIPCRLLMTIAYCLINWGKLETEPWVRVFSSHILILYLIISGYLSIKKSLLVQAVNTGYSGVLEVIREDMKATFGRVAPPVPHTLTHDKSLDYLFIFNNNYYFGHTTATVTGKNPSTRK